VLLVNVKEEVNELEITERAGILNLIFLYGKLEESL